MSTSRISSLLVRLAASLPKGTPERLRVLKMASTYRDWRGMVRDRLDDMITEKLREALMEAALESAPNWKPDGDQKIEGTFTYQYRPDDAPWGEPGYGEEAEGEIEITFPENFISEEWVRVDLRDLVRALQKDVLREASRDAGAFFRDLMSEILIDGYAKDLLSDGELLAEDVDIENPPDEVEPTEVSVYAGYSDDADDEASWSLWLADEGTVEIRQIRGDLDRLEILVWMTVPAHGSVE